MFLIDTNFNIFQNIQHFFHKKFLNCLNINIRLLIPQDYLFTF